LRLQYEEQRDRLLANNDKDLQRAKQMGDEKLKRMKDTYDQDQALGRMQLAALEEQMQTREADFEHKKRNCDAISAENAAFERDVQMWKNMFESTNKQRQEQERDLAHLRQEWTRQKHTTQEIIDSTEAKRQNAENDLEIMSNQFVEYKRQCTARGTALTSRINAMEEALNTTKTQIEESKLQLSEITDHLAKVTSDGLVENNKAAETIHKLEREFDQQNLDWQEEKKHFDSALDAERRKANEQRDRLEKCKETHQQQLRQLQEEGNMRLQNVEREKNRQSEKSRQEVEQYKKELEVNQRKVDHLKEQIARTRSTFHDTQSAFETVKRETQRNERSIYIMMEQYADELRTAKEATEQAQKSVFSISRQYEQSKARFDQNRKKMMKDFDEIKSGSSIHLTET